MHALREGHEGRAALLLRSTMWERSRPSVFPVSQASARFNVPCQAPRPTNRRRNHGLPTVCRQPVVPLRMQTRGPGRLQVHRLPPTRPRQELPRRSTRDQRGSDLRRLQTVQPAGVLLRLRSQIKGNHRMRSLRQARSFNLVLPTAASGGRVCLQRVLRSSQPRYLQSTRED